MHTLLYISILMIALLSNVEENPGPCTPKFPCQICEKAVIWKQKGIACDDGQQWYHVQCMCMTTHMYETLSNHSNLSWHCDNCGMSNFATSLFESFILDSQNSFSILNSSAATSTSTPGPPPHVCFITHQLTKEETNPLIPESKNASHQLSKL